MLIQSREQFEAARTTLIEAELIAIDTETNWTNNWDSRHLMGISTFCPVPTSTDHYVAFYFPFRHNPDKTLFPKYSDNLPIEWLRELQIALERENVQWIFHNAKFDVQVFAKEGIDICGFYYDTVILSHMDNENKFSHELDDLAKLVRDKKLRSELHTIAKQLGNGKIEVGWSKIPPEVMSLYAEGDARITWELKHFFEPRLKEQELWHLYPREYERSRVLTRMEQRGIGVDKEIATQLSLSAQNQMTKSLAEFGYDPMKPSQLAHRLFGVPPEGLGLQPSGWSSRKSVEFSQGLPIMNAEVLSRLNHPEAQKVLDYRSWMKADGTWYKPWVTMCDRNDRVHPSYRQHGTKTTRLSCEKPNMQQIPRNMDKTPVKKMLKAKDDYELWSFDYNQIEFRLAVVYAEVPELMEGLKGDLDVHKVTMELCGIQELTGLSFEDARYVGKQSNFALLYGAGYEVLLKQIWRDARLELPDHVGEAIHSEFHRAYPQFRQIAYKAERGARKRGWVKGWTGRKRHFDVAWECHKAFNSIIQMGAAEIVCDSMIKLDKEGFELVSQVHDDIWIEIPKDEVEEQKTKILSIMDWASVEFPIPFTVGAKKLA